MNYLNQIPLARLVIPLMVGIATALYSPVQVPFLWFCLVAVGLIALMVFLSAKGQKRSAWFGGVATLFFALFGYQLVILNTVSHVPGYFGNYLQGTNYIVGRISQPPQLKARSVKSIVDVEAIKTPKGWVKASGCILTYFESDDMAYALAYGDRLAMHVAVTEISPPLNPGQFDYKSYLARKGIYHQAFVKEPDYVFIESHVGSQLMEWVYQVRQYMHWLLGESGLKGPELAVASALVLGDDDDIDPDLLQAYSASGTLHVLSVSGMHAGLVFVMLGWLLAFMGQGATARYTRVAVIIVSLWLYALLTGFSPPVIRAAVMFSLLALGKSSAQYTNNYNILAGSCLLMLLYDPFLLADVGFQLSYIAVLGIALFYPCLHRLWNLNERIEITTHRKPGYLKYPIKLYNWLIGGAWSITAMSMAAQLATLPLGLYYFHQFPVYFIAANLIIIPLSVLCIWGGMLLLVVSWIPMVNTGVGFLLNYMLQALNYLAVFSEKLPNATWSNFKLNKVEVAAMFLIIGVIFVALKSAKKQWLYTGLVSAVVFMGCKVYQKADSLNQQKLIVYQVNKASAVEVISGSQSLLLADTTCVPGTINYKFNIDASQWYFDIKNRSINTPSPLAYNNLPLLAAGNKTMLLYSPKFNPGYISINGKIDYVLVSGTPYLDYAFIENIKPELVVFDGSNKPSKLKYWTKKLGQLHIPYHNTAAQGAWVADIN